MANEKTPAEPVVEPVAEPVVEPAAPAVVAPVVVPVATPEVPTAPVADVPDESMLYVAARDFRAFFAHQVQNFKEGDVLDAHVGHALRKTGSPIKLVEKLAGEIKAAL